MKFDVVYEKGDGNDKKITYGILQGDNKVVFIKAGAGGSHTGYENKYLKIAHWLHNTLGCTVICSSYPDDKLSQEDDESFIMSYVAKHNIGEPSYYFIGVSRGAYYGLTFLRRRFDFKRMLLINMPLMLNYHKIKAALKSTGDTEVIFVYGDKDPSYSYLPFLSSSKELSIQIKTAEGADHNFKGMLSEFIELAKLIFGEEI